MNDNGFIFLTKQDGIHCQGPRPPTAFSVPNINKKLERGRRGENVSLKTHTPQEAWVKNS